MLSHTSPTFTSPKIPMLYEYFDNQEHTTSTQSVRKNCNSDFPGDENCVRQK